MTDSAIPAAGRARRALFSIYLLLTGLAAGAVLAFPHIVLFGLFLGILPGIVLGFVPTLFFYSLLWWGTRALLLRFAAYRGVDIGAPGLHPVIGAVSAVIVALPITLAPMFINATIKDKVAMLRAEDEELAAPISFPLVVAVAVPNRENLALRRALPAPSLQWRHNARDHRRTSPCPGR